MKTWARGCCVHVFLVLLGKIFLNPPSRCTILPSKKIRSLNKSEESWLRGSAMQHCNKGIPTNKDNTLRITYQ